MLDLLNTSLLADSTFHDAQRLFHGRGHAWPGYEHVVVDHLPPVVLITVYQEVEADVLMQWAKGLMSQVPGCRSVQVQYRCRPMAPIEVLLGEPLEQIQVEEQGLRYHIHLGRAQNTGLFLDMRNGRHWVREHSQNSRVLNLFAYTCGFSVAALAGGASKVVNVDMSRASLTTGRENHRLNTQDTHKVVFEGVDIFKSFSRLKKHGPYEMLIADPPTFQKGSVDIERDYKKIIRRIPELVVPGGWVMLCLNAPDLDQNFLRETVSEHCPQCVFVEELANPPVYVEAMAGKGLKVMIYRYEPAPE